MAGLDPAIHVFLSVVKTSMPGSSPAMTNGESCETRDVIASQRVGAKRRPMTGSAKQSIPPLAEAWIASSLRSSQ
jgi:hypothetical protein